MRLTYDAHLVLRARLAKRRAAQSDRPTVLEIAKDLGWPIVEVTTTDAPPRRELGS